MRLFDASPTAVAKKVHGSIPAKTISAYGAVAIGGQVSQFAENDGEDDHRQKRPD